MPELPEVQTIASDLQELLAGQKITAVLIDFEKIVDGDPAQFSELVTGADIESVTRFGKWIRVSLSKESGPAVMLAHLKMTGQFHLGRWPRGETWPPHARAAFRVPGLGPDNDTLFYKDIRKFGRLRAFYMPDFEEFAGKLGLAPDPFETDFADFHARLTAKKGRLKTVLLDQKIVAGLGNIYVDEILFAARLLPETNPQTLTPADTGRVLTEARRILAASIKARGSTVNNYQGLKGPGSFQHQHRVYGRGGQPCPVCGTAIEKTTLGGRGTHHCPRCQH